MKRCYNCFREYEDHIGVCPFCGKPEITEPNEPIQLIPGTVLAERYIVGTAVGAGGFGIVYKAYDTKLEAIVAVKEFFVTRIVTRAQGESEVIVSKKTRPEFEYRKERFLAEARNMAKFGSHRSIPNVFEYFEENGTAYIIMELLQGTPLNDYMYDNNNQVDIEFGLFVANEVGNALISLHKEGIIHRDVAPDNIFLCSGMDIRVKLMDLGAAKLTDTVDDVKDIILKPGYSPTEQYDNCDNIGPWTDIYALGATLYILLTGIKPDESTNRKVQDEVVPPHEINPEVSVNLSNAVMKAMAIEQHMRFRTVDEFLEAINGERKVLSLEAEKRKNRIIRTVGISIALIIVAIAALFGLHTYKDKQSESFLNPATISVWYAVREGSTENDAMESVKEDFENTFPDVSLELRAINEEDYATELEAAALNGTLPALFESTGLSDTVLEAASDLKNIIKSEQFGNALFLSQYGDYYDDRKQIPLGIEAPLAFVITNGASCVDYGNSFFSETGDFGQNVNISADGDCRELLNDNFDIAGMADKTEFYNNEANTSPVLLSSTMKINELQEVNNKLGALRKAIIAAAD